MSENLEDEEEKRSTLICRYQNSKAYSPKEFTAKPSWTGVS